jgi:hypothetical protein
MNYNINSGYGQMLAVQLAASVGPIMGRILVVLEDSDPNVVQNIIKNIFTPDPDGNVRFFTTLEAAYAAATSNANDVILLSAHSTNAIATGIAWTKNRINVIGTDGGGRLVQQGAKVELSGAVDSAYVLKVTGVRNSFRNIKLIQSSTHANALTTLQCGGEGNYYQNVSAVFGVVDNLDQATAYEVVMGEDSGTFIDCLFGTETLLTSAARANIIIDQVTDGQECKSNIFKDCTWLISSSNTGAQSIKMAAAGDILFTNHFIRPSFLASIDSAGGVALTKAVSTANGTVKGTIYISYPVVHGFSDIGVNGTNNDNLYVFSHVPSAVDITSVQPTTT